MQRDRSPRRRLLIPAATVAVIAGLLVLLVSGLFSTGRSVAAPAAAQARELRQITRALGGGPGTIVIQRTRMMQMTPKSSSGPATRFDVSQLEITGSAEGRDLGDFFTTSSRRDGFEQLERGDVMELYDPLNQTIDVTTQSAWTRAIAPPPEPGTGSTSSSISFTYAPAGVSGPASTFAAGLRKHLYRIAGTTTINGRPALKLVPVRVSIVVSKTSNGSVWEDFGTVWVSPQSFDPIHEVTRAPAVEGFAAFTTVTDWSEYAVVPATTQNRWLVSLTRRHPHARVVHSTRAYIAAEASANLH